MGRRVRRIVVHFPSAFRLAAVDAIQPAGAYAVDLEEEAAPGELQTASECAGMHIQLVAMLDGRLAIRSVPITSSELGMAILDGTGPGAATRLSAD